MTPGCRTQRVRAPAGRRERRRRCVLASPLAGRVYVGREEHGRWTVIAADAAGHRLLAATSARHELAAAILVDAFPACRVRADLIDAFAELLDDAAEAFVLEASLVAGWALRWALERSLDV